MRQLQGEEVVYVLRRPRVYLGDAHLVQLGQAGTDLDEGAAHVLVAVDAGAVLQTPKNVSIEFHIQITLNDILYLDILANFCLRTMFFQLLNVLSSRNFLKSLSAKFINAFV